MKICVTINGKVWKSAVLLRLIAEKQEATLVGPTKELVLFYIKTSLLCPGRPVKVPFSLLAMVKGLQEKVKLSLGLSQKEQLATNY